jgi:hypothetical protein
VRTEGIGMNSGNSENLYRRDQVSSQATTLSRASDTVEGVGHLNHMEPRACLEGFCLVYC